MFWGWWSQSNGAADARNVRLRAYEYAHISNDNTGVTELVTGPLCRKLQSHESLAKAPTPFHVVPATHYAVVRNPHERLASESSVNSVSTSSSSGGGVVGVAPPWEVSRMQAARGSDGQVRCRMGHEELRYWRAGTCVVVSETATACWCWCRSDSGRMLAPFPLYPDEELVSVAPMETVPSGRVLILQALADFEVITGGGGDEGGGATLPAALAPMTGATAAKSARQSTTTGAAATTQPPPVRRAMGHRYTLRGPATYYPHPCERVEDRQSVRVVRRNTALHCRARETCTLDGETEPRTAGTEWLHVTVGEYVPIPCVEVVGVVEALALGPDGGVHVKVREAYRDQRLFSTGVPRNAGDVFMVTADECAQLLLHPYDKIIRHVQRVKVTSREYCVVATRVTSEDAIAARSGRGAAAADGGSDDSGDEGEDGQGENVVDSTEQASSRRYRDRRVISGAVFFLRPGEALVVPPRPVHILAADEALLVQALESFIDTESENGDTTSATATVVPTATTTSASESTVRRARGDRWLVRGPRRYVPSPRVCLISDPTTGTEIRRRVLQAEGEGIYIRHVPTGVVRLIAGPCSYMLEADEETWVKPLAPHVQRRIAARPTTDVPRASPLPASATMAATTSDALGNGPAARRTAHSGGWGGGSPILDSGAVHGVSYHIPNRSVTQLFNYRTQRTRTIFGPNRVLLEPDEDFTVVSLSGSPWDPARPNKCLPKETGRITALYLFLGPSNMSDVLEVETSDHARLSLQLCYDWCFDCPHGDAGAANQCFLVNDFVGNTCSFIASRIRAAVASMPFKQFHERSAQVLRTAVFGLDEATGGPASTLRFPANRLLVTSVDIQEMQVLDERTLRGLQKSVKMAIEIATHTQGVRAQQVATTRAQEARGILDRRRMNDQVANEEQRKVLLETESAVLAIVSSSKSTAMAEAMSLAATIETDAAVAAARIRAEREALVNSTLAEVQRRRRLALTTHEASMEAEGGRYQRALEAIQHDLMDVVIGALGPDTLAEVAKAGPELQATLLKSMGLEGYLITDGTTPINLFQAAAGLTGGGTSDTATGKTAAVVASSAQ